MIQKKHYNYLTVAAPGTNFEKHFQNMQYFINNINIRDLANKILEIIKTTKQVVEIIHKINLAILDAINPFSFIFKLLRLPNPFAIPLNAIHDFFQKTTDDIINFLNTELLRKLNEYTLSHGTSFAAPLITNLLAMLKTEYKEKMEAGDEASISKNILIASSSFNGQTQNNLYDPKIGFGIPNYKLMKQAIENSVFKKIEIGINYEMKKSFESSQPVRVSSSWVANNGIEMELSILNGKGEIVFKRNNNNWNVLVGEFTPIPGEEYTFRIGNRNRYRRDPVDVSLTYVQK
ncbi:hypothetical protein EI74_0434 [Mycoplasma testudineum]|uniref:Peptidase S8/S53 domain-containing protein n=1 Tax=Mycoplasma testudineum TaxID=244584 RepID=A0A4R6IF09_9MOLU|nr:hypothetical protein [Mycoplasma testudineum]TDO20356.1 hypothetical protein EI74_0434 [Mycoplasma testudineum]